jgi:hypothetical protein
MVITAAHVPAIVALIAGILILIMPRLLELHRRDLPDLHRPRRARPLEVAASVTRESALSRLARNPPKWCKARKSQQSFSDSGAMAKAVAKPKKIAAKSKASAPARKAAPAAARKPLKKAPAKPLRSRQQRRARRPEKWVYTFGDGKAKAKRA